MKRLRPRTTLAVQVLVMFVLLVWQLRKMLARQALDLRESPADMLREQHGLWPFHVVAWILHIQFIICFTIALFMFPVLRYAKDPGRGELFFLSQMQRAAAVIGIVGLVASLEYRRMGQSAKVRVGEGSFFGVSEPRIADRYMMWAILAPMEWLPYTMLYTCAAPVELCKIMVQTTIMCLLGSAAVLNDQDECALTLLLYTAACLVFAGLMRHVASLPLERATQSMQRKCFRFLMVMWSAYPVLHILRTLGLLTAWTDQVLLTSLFDAIAKCALHLFCWTGPLCQLWVSALGNLQTARSNADCNLTIEGDSWTIAPGAGSSASTQEHLLGSDAKGSNFLQHVIHEDQRQAVERAAEQVDRDANFMAHKMQVDMRLSGGRAGKAELLIARSLYGRRQIALRLLEETCVSTAKPSFDGWSRCSTEEVFNRGDLQASSLTESLSIGSVISMRRLSPKHHAGAETVEEQV